MPSGKIGKSSKRLPDSSNLLPARLLIPREAQRRQMRSDLHLQLSARPAQHAMRISARPNDLRVIAKRDVLMIRRRRFLTNSLALGSALSCGIAPSLVLGDERLVLTAGESSFSLASEYSADSGTFSRYSAIACLVSASEPMFSSDSIMIAMVQGGSILGKA